MVIIDCSAAIAIILEGEHGKALEKLMLANEQVLAPQLFYVEVNSTLSKYVRAGRHSLEQAQKYAQQTLRLVDEFVDHSENYAEALAEGIRLGHSVYDMFYFTLARRNAATLFTLDKRLIKLCEQNGVDCVHIIS